MVPDMNSIFVIVLGMGFLNTSHIAKCQWKRAAEQNNGSSMYINFNKISD